MYREKQGHLDDLALFPLPQLQDLLLRQERILKNDKLLRTLPDGGRKIRSFAETLRKEIRQRESLDELSEAFKNQITIVPKSAEYPLVSNDKEGRSNAEGIEEHHVVFRGKIAKGDVEEQHSVDSKKDTVVIQSALNGQSMTMKKKSKFKTDREALRKQGDDDLLRARGEDVVEKKNVLSEIFMETRMTQPVKARFKENVPLQKTDVKSIPKPPSIRRLIAQRPSSKSSLPSSLLEDCLHPPTRRCDTTRVISLAESLDLQKKLKSTHESRMVEDAAARLVDRLRGQALPERVETAQPWLERDPEVVSRLLGSRLKVDGDSSAAVEGRFVEYREKRDLDDLDDALYDEVNQLHDDDGLQDS